MSNQSSPGNQSSLGSRGSRKSLSSNISMGSRSSRGSRGSRGSRSSRGSRGSRGSRSSSGSLSTHLSQSPPKRGKTAKKKQRGRPRSRGKSRGRSRSRVKKRGRTRSRGKSMGRSSFRGKAPEKGKRKTQKKTNQGKQKQVRKKRFKIQPQTMNDITKLFPLQNSAGPQMMTGPPPPTLAWVQRQNPGKAPAQKMGNVGNVVMTAAEQKKPDIEEDDFEILSNLADTYSAITELLENDEYLRTLFFSEREYEKITEEEIKSNEHKVKKFEKLILKSMEKIEKMGSKRRVEGWLDKLRIVLASPFSDETNLKTMSLESKFKGLPKLFWLLLRFYKKAIPIKKSYQTLYDILENKEYQDGDKVYLTSQHPYLESTIILPYRIDRMGKNIQLQKVYEHGGHGFLEVLDSVRGVDYITNKNLKDKINVLQNAILTVGNELISAIEENNLFVGVKGTQTSQKHMGNIQNEVLEFNHRLVDRLPIIKRMYNIHTSIEKILRVKTEDEGIKHAKQGLVNKLRNKKMDIHERKIYTLQTLLLRELEKRGEEPSKRAKELSQKLNKAWMIFTSEKKRLMDSGKMDKQISYFHGKTPWSPTERKILGYMVEGDDAMRDLNRLMKSRIAQRNRDKSNKSKKAAALKILRRFIAKTAQKRRKQKTRKLPKKKKSPKGSKTRRK